MERKSLKDVAYEWLAETSHKRIVKTNNKIEVTIGDDDGAHRTLHTTFKEADTEEKLRVWAEGQLNSLKYTGYYGSFETFGERYVRPGDSANLVSIKYPEKDGVYLITNGIRSFGLNGYRQKIELGPRIGFKN